MMHFMKKKHVNSFLLSCLAERGSVCWKKKKGERGGLETHLSGKRWRMYAGAALWKKDGKEKKM